MCRTMMIFARMTSAKIDKKVRADKSTDKITYYFRQDYISASKILHQQDRTTRRVGLTCGTRKASCRNAGGSTCRSNCSC